MNFIAMIGSLKRVVLSCRSGVLGVHRILAVIVMSFFGLIAPIARAASSASSSAAYVKPVKILGTVKASSDGHERSVVASYQLACGESFRGALVREKNGASKQSGYIYRSNKKYGGSAVVLELAVVVERTEAFCSSLPATVEMSLPVYGNVRVRALKTPESRRIVLAEAIDVSTTSQGILIGWQSGCRSNVGVILKPLADKRGPKIEISLAMKPREDLSLDPPANCQRQIRYLGLSGLRIAAHDLVLAERPGKIEDSYLLRLVAPESVSVSQDGRIAVQWNKNCREQALGLLFTGVDGRQLALLTAFMPSVPCRGQKTQKASYSMPEGFLVPHAKSLAALNADLLSAIAQKAQFDYQILPAASIESARLGDGEQLSVDAKELNCSQTIGVLVAGDSYGNTSIGVLAADSNTVCPLRTSNSNGLRRSVVPLVGPRVGPIPKVFGLRVLGSTFN